MGKLVKKSPSDILAAGVKTFKERRAVYGDNYKRVGAVMAALFEDGLGAITPEEHMKVEIMYCLVIKLTRFANSDMHHKDSIHDLVVFAAMMESLLE